MSWAPAKLMKTEERRNGVRGTKYTEEEGVSLRLAVRNLWFDSKDFGFMRFEGSFQKENQMYQWKVYAKSVIFIKCFLNLILLYQVGEQWTGFLGFKKNNSYDLVLQIFGDVLQWVRRPVLGKQKASEPRAEE